MKNISTEDSNRITSLRFLLIMFVVFIHNNLTSDDAIYYNLPFSEPAAITHFKFIVTGLLGGAAVPLFFLFAGYLQFLKNDDYAVLLKKRAKSLAVPYFAWTLLNVLLFFAAQSVPQLSSFFQDEHSIVRHWNFGDWLNLFWVHSEANPFVYQFWFVRDLIILIALSPILHFVAQKMPLAALSAITLCYWNGLPLGFSTALFFYAAGYFFAEYRVSPFKIADKIRYPEYAILLLSVLILHIFHLENLLHGLGTIFSCLFFLKLSLFIVSKEKLFSLTSYLAGFSFFLYAIHTPFLGTSLNKISMRLIPLENVGCLVQFIIPSVLCIAIGTGIGIFTKRFLPPVFKILNGSR